MYIYLAIGAVVVFIICLILFAISWKLCNVILKPKIWSTEEIRLREIETGRLDVAFYESIKKENFTLASRYGYQLSGIVLSNEETEKPINSIKIAVLCHGYTWGKLGAVVYAQMLMELGFTSVIYDHRNHGDSGKAPTSMGYYEKYDLETVINYCYERFGKDIKIVTHGESMGAATVLNYLEIDDRITCTIADCGYSDLRELLKHSLWISYHLPAFLVLPFANIIFKLRAGFYINEVSPRKGAINSKTPILFIHGDEDNFVPTSMSLQMYDKRIDSKELYLCKGAKHAVSCNMDRIRYLEEITKFLDKYYV